jgi:hypothetical protein
MTCLCVLVAWDYGGDRPHAAVTTHDVNSEWREHESEMRLVRGMVRTKSKRSGPRIHLGRVEYKRLLRLIDQFWLADIKHAEAVKANPHKNEQ